jgi:transcriptional regulator with XRE-family HTH domain
MAARSTGLDHRPRPGPSPVGRLLQHWRRVRRMSQLDLAVEAQVTPRHVSFVESGRPGPAARWSWPWPAATAMFAWLLGRERSERPANVLRLMFDPEGLRPFVANWEQVAEALVQRVHREAIGGVPDPDTAALLQELLALPGVPDRWRAPDFTAAPLPVIPVALRKGRLAVSYFSMVTTVGTPQDITAEEIRLESFFPADQATERRRWT